MLQEELGRLRLQAMKTFLLRLHLDRHDFHQVLQVDFLQHFPIRNNNKKIGMTIYFYSIPLKNSNINSCLMYILPEHFKNETINTICRFISTKCLGFSVAHYKLSF